MKRTVSLLGLAALTIAALGQEQSLPPALLAMINTERAFAETSVEQGWRDAFIAFFADEGINFMPHPVKTREALRQRPPQPRPLSATLNWAPLYGDVARAGDLGYSTGPALITDSTGKEPPRHSVFFSFWKRQPDGNWRVVVDLGAQLPAAVAPLNAPFQRAPQRQSKAPGVSLNAASGRAELLKIEQDFFARARASGTAAWQYYLSDDARIYRQQVMPIISKEALRAWVTKQYRAVSGEPMAADVSRSNDLGYAYGRYEVQAAGQDKLEKGYYVRAWKRDEQGRWRIVFDVTTLLPEG